MNTESTNLNSTAAVLRYLNTVVQPIRSSGNLSDEERPPASQPVPLPPPPEDGVGNGIDLFA